VRPGSAQSPGNSQRMPLEAAEALLWGKQTRDEHVYLYERMKQLEQQHRDYDARIQDAETIAVAADAATARVRRVEQQVAAIESDEQDRPFDKWAEEEISGFKKFIEKHMNVRQKQIELEEKISHMEDSAGQARDVSKDIEILLDRIARLEQDHISDANQIRKLESDVNNLTTLPQLNEAVETDMLLGNTIQRQKVDQMPPPPSRQQNAGLQDDTETEDDNENENFKTPFTTVQQGQEEVQVLRSPEIKAQ